MLRTLLGGDEDDDEEKAEREGEIEDGELNEIIARNEEELEWYTKMDEERRAREEEEWKREGNTGQLPPRLIQDSELPDLFLIDVNEPEQVKVELPTGRGARARKNIAYDDGLTEDQFLNAVDEGDLDGFIAKKEAKAARMKEAKARKAEDHQRRRAAGEEVDSDAEAFEDVPDDPLAIPDPDQDEAPIGGEKRTLGDDFAEIDEGNPQKKKKRGVKGSKKNFADVDPEMVDALEPQARANLTSILLSCYKAVEEAEVGVEGEEGY